MHRLVLVLCLAVGVLADDSLFDDYEVYRLRPANLEQVKVLIHLKRDGRFDFWTFPHHAGKAVDIKVRKENKEAFLSEVNAANITCDTLLDSLMKVANDKLRGVVATSDHEGKISFSQYNSLGKINAYLDELAEAYPDVVSLETIGKSYEGRDMRIIKISTHPNTSKPIFFIDAGIHAREWAAPATAIYVIHQLLENPENAALLEKVDWHVLPVVNPDGYEYTLEVKHLMWRKTRSIGEHCNGVDGNRNFDYHWGEEGASGDECDESYSGPTAFSEPETQALRDHILKYKNSIKLYLSLHGFGGYILYPWGYTADLSDNDKELHDLGNSVAEAIKSVNGTDFTVGSTTKTLYAAAGTSLDWAKGEAGVELAYVIELRGEGVIGFYPPPEYLLTIASETWTGIKVFHHYIEEKYGEK